MLVKSRNQLSLLLHSKTPLSSVYTPQAHIVCLPLSLSISLFPSLPSLPFRCLNRSPYSLQDLFVVMALTES